MGTAAPSLLDEVASVLRDGGWDYFACQSRSALLVLAYGEHGTMPCLLETPGFDRQLSVRAEFPVHVPRAEIPAIHEYAARATLALAVEHFELDLDQGILAVKAGADFDGTPVTLPLVSQLLADVISTADRHFDTVLRLTTGATDPVEALERLQRMTVAQAMRMASRAVRERRG